MINHISQFAIRSIWQKPILELSPLNGFIMFCLKEKKYDLKPKTYLPNRVSPTDVGIGSIRQMSQAVIQEIWLLPLYIDTSMMLWSGVKYR